jgi:hypothetical protein
VDRVIASRARKESSTKEGKTAFGALRSPERVDSDLGYLGEKKAKLP